MCKVGQVNSLGCCCCCAVCVLSFPNNKTDVVILLYFHHIYLAFDGYMNSWPASGQIQLQTSSIISRAPPTPTFSLLTKMTDCWCYIHYIIQPPPTNTIGLKSFKGIYNIQHFIILSEAGHKVEWTEIFPRSPWNIFVTGTAFSCYPTNLNQVLFFSSVRDRSRCIGEIRAVDRSWPFCVCATIIRQSSILDHVKIGQFPLWST